MGGMALGVSPTSILVKPERALAQTAPAGVTSGDEQIDGDPGHGGGEVGDPTATQVTLAPTVLQGALHVDPVRAVKSFGQLADEVLVHLQAEGKVEIVVELRATSPKGFSESVVRTVTENVRVLKFESGAGFEAD